MATKCTQAKGCTYVEWWVEEPGSGFKNHFESSCFLVHSLKHYFFLGKNRR
jgi:hypothetical protein